MSMSVSSSVFQTTIQSLLPTLEKYGLEETSMSTHNQYQSYSAIRKSNQLDKTLRILQVNINMIELWFQKQSFNTLLAEEAYSDYYIEDCFIDLLVESMSLGQTIWIFFDYTDYVVSDEHSKFEYESHGTCGILIPNQLGVYSFYYINSHGRFLNYELECDYRLSTTRKKSIDLSTFKNLDHWFLQQFVDTLRKYRSIQFTFTPNYVYMGPDLQVGDTHGFCYLFPFVMFLCFTRSFHESIQTLLSGQIKSLILEYISHFHRTRISSETILKKYYNSILLKMIQEIITITL